MSKALFLDVDGVLNQYNIHERKRRYKIDKQSTFNPFRKKVLRLSKLIKKFNLDVYVFSAWTLEDVLPHFPKEVHKFFKGDTKKWISRMNEISKQYRYSVVIDDELSSYNSKFLETGKSLKDEEVQINSNIIQYQPYYEFGLVKEDFIKIKGILNDFR